MRSSGSANKITVVGAGQVGMACVVSILTQRISTDICLIDIEEDKLTAEAMDIEQSSMFFNNCKISASTEYAITAGSKLCIVTVGVRQRSAESPLDLAQKNTEMMKSVIPELIEYSPDTILLIVTNPVDILTYVAWKLSGLPKERVIGTGTNLASSRFKYLIAQKLSVSPNTCNGWIIGENGESSIPVWSAVNVSGVNLTYLHPSAGVDDDLENWSDIHREIINCDEQVIRQKGYASWSLGMSVADIAQAVLSNSKSAHAVSVLARGYYEIEEEVFLSLPVILGINGAVNIVVQPLSAKELATLRESAKNLAEMQQELDI